MTPGTGPVAASDVADAFIGFMDDRDNSRAVTHLVTRLDPSTASAPERRRRSSTESPSTISLEGRRLRADGTILDDLLDDHYLVERERDGDLALRRAAADLGPPPEARMSAHTSALSRFTPSLMSHELLERLFVVRERTLDAIMARVDAAAATSERNHTLLVGPRGAGKTHLVALAYHRINERRRGGRRAAGGLAARGSVDDRVLPAPAGRDRGAPRAASSKARSRARRQSSNRCSPLPRQPAARSSCSSRTSTGSSTRWATRASSSSATSFKPTGRCCSWRRARAWTGRCRTRQARSTGSSRRRDSSPSTSTRPPRC